MNFFLPRLCLSKRRAAKACVDPAGLRQLGNGAELVAGVCVGQIAGAKQYARMAVCQLDTLTYLIVSCESVLDENSSGMTLKEFEECLQEVEGKLDGYEIKLAYNIDGGGSTTMVFHNKKINSLTNPKVRDLSDILYFVSIYSEGRNFPCLNFRS